MLLPLPFKLVLCRVVVVDVDEVVQVVVDALLTQILLMARIVDLLTRKGMVS